MKKASSGWIDGELGEAVGRGLAQQELEPPDEAAEVVADHGENSVDRISAVHSIDASSARAFFPGALNH